MQFNKTPFSGRELTPEAREESPVNNIFCLAHYDMYGNPIHVIGESGYGISLAFGQTSGEELVRPLFALFHQSDGFRQCLFTFSIEEDRPQLSNIFQNRIRELMETNPHAGAFNAV